METKANYALIGAFTLAGFMGLLGFLMWFAKLEFDRQFAYYDVYFQEVSGLAVASDVRFAGLIVGRVVDMELAPASPGPVRVRIELAEDTPIRTDSRASLEVQGVTGVSNLAISPGRPSSELLRETSGEGVPVIRSSRSALQTLSDQGPEIIERLNIAAERLIELLGDENQQRVHNILDNVERSSSNLDQAMADISQATDSIRIAAEGIAQFGERAGGLTNSADTALKKFTETAAIADDTLTSATAALDEAAGYISGDLKGLTQRLDETAQSLQADLSRLAGRADSTLDNLDAVLEVGKSTLASAERAFDGADQIMNTDLGPVISDFRGTLARLNGAIDNVVDDLPAITGGLRDAADSAQSAFAALRSMLDGARGPVQAFATEALPQFSRLSSELRDLVENLNQLVTSLRRNPSQIFNGPRAPEFRR